jgi:predicted acetyltransferase
MTTKKAFLLKINKELAGFVLLDKMKLLQPVDWNMGKFFVLAKFQGKGVADSIDLQIFKNYPGIWSVAVMPENIKAAKFWRNIISQVTNGNFFETFKTEDELRTKDNPDPYAMIIFTFDSKSKNVAPKENYIIDKVSGTIAESRLLPPVEIFET